jgi:hypothetical protein
MRGAYRNRNNPNNRNNNRGFRVVLAAESRSNAEFSARQCRPFTDWRLAPEHDKAPSGWAA